MCNLLHAVFSPWRRTHPHKPRHNMTHSDTCWRPASRTQPVLGNTPVTHTLPLLRSHPHPGRRRCSRRAPPAGPRRRFCAPFPLPRRETATGRGGMSSRCRPPGRPGLTRSRCRRPRGRGLSREDCPRAPPCRAVRGGSRRWWVGGQLRRDWGWGLPTPEGAGFSPRRLSGRLRPVLDFGVRCWWGSW